MCPYSTYLSTSIRSGSSVQGIHRLGLAIAWKPHILLFPSIPLLTPPKDLITADQSTYVIVKELRLSMKAVEISLREEFLKCFFLGGEWGQTLPICPYLSPLELLGPSVLR